MRTDIEQCVNCIVKLKFSKFVVFCLVTVANVGHLDLRGVSDTEVKIYVIINHRSELNFALNRNKNAKAIDKAWKNNFLNTWI